MNSVIANRIYNLISDDPVKIAILDLLVDGKWHTRFEVESLAKVLRPTIGLVGICTIIRTLQDADSNLVEIYNNDSGVFYRLNPERSSMVQKIISYSKTPTKLPSTTSAKQYQRFKDLIKTTKPQKTDLDDDLKHFL
ncbi:MAG: hypothetical protein JXA54_12105 [Candidatus Heimdallarchaeota archaeon]|nr:hypothetical protein [Candidatus Heimdallarchaeota archaeon]